MLDVELDPKILDELVIPENEQISGNLSDRTRNTFESIMLDSAETEVKIY